MLKLLPFIFLFCISSHISAFNSDSLGNLIQQADVVLLLQLPNSPTDSLAYFVDDLGSNFYNMPIKDEKIVKNNTY